jgi:ABC-2 type transport system permease protein
MMGGLAMVFKRMQSVGGFIGIAFLPLVAAPVERVHWLKLLPIAHGNMLLRHVLVNGRSVFAEPTELLILTVVSASYVLAGILVFLALERQARERALLGQY